MKKPSNKRPNLQEHCLLRYWEVKSQWHGQIPAGAIPYTASNAIRILSILLDYPGVSKGLRSQVAELRQEIILKGQRKNTKKSNALKTPCVFIAIR